MYFLIKTIQLILCLTILVIIHELGHFIPAIIFNTRVERFFIFFDPWFSIFKKKIGNTIYGIGWIPLGGYVKISGMINENIDNNKKILPPKEWEFVSKTPLKKLIIMLGGISMNILLAIIIFSGILFLYGEQDFILNNKINKYGINVNKLGSKIGLKNGDIIKNIDNKYINNLKKLHISIILGNNINILRNNKLINIKLDNEKKKILFDRKEIDLFILPRLPVIIKNIIKNSNAYKIGLKSNDEIISINSKSYVSLNQINKILFKQSNNYINTIIKRNNKYIKKILKVDKYGNIGAIFINFNDLNINFVEKKYNLLDSISKGIQKTWDIFTEQFNFFKQIFNLKTNAYKQIGSIFSIAKVFSPQWNWILFWNITATLSIWLAFINLLPIPSLDGCHALFIFIELLFKKKINENIVEIINIIGFIILMIFMLIIIIWDTFKNLI